MSLLSSLTGGCIGGSGSSTPGAGAPGPSGVGAGDGIGVESGKLLLEPNSVVGAPTEEAGSAAVVVSTGGQPATGGACGAGAGVEAVVSGAVGGAIGAGVGAVGSFNGLA